MKDVILIVVLAAIFGLAIWYIVKAKKNGKKCIGCPNGCCPSQNGGSCSGCSGCGTDEK